MGVRSWVVRAGAAGAVVAGIAVVQGGVTGTPWPSSAPARSSTAGPGLPAPRESAATAPVPAGTVAAEPETVDRAPAAVAAPSGPKGSGARSAPRKDPPARRDGPKDDRKQRDDSAGPGRAGGDRHDGKRSRSGKD